MSNNDLPDHEVHMIDREYLKNVLIEAADELYSAFCVNARTHDARQSDALNNFAAASNAYRATLRPQPGERWMNVKTNGHYKILHVGRMKLDWTTWGVDLDMRDVVIYQSVGDGSVWSRLLSEFMDGRFTRLT